MYDKETEERYKAWTDKEYREKKILYQGPNPQDLMRWGYIDRNGVLKIPLQFERAEAFSEGAAAVRFKRKWGYIDAAYDWSSVAA